MEERLQNTIWEPLCGGARVLVSPQHTFGTDAVLLAHFAAPPAPGSAARTCGTGCGVIPLLWRVRAQGGGHRPGAELQPRRPPALARRSVEENGFSRHGRHCAGGRPGSRRRSSPAGSLDWHRLQPAATPRRGRASPSERGRPAAPGPPGETASPWRMLARAARSALRYGGRLCLCLRPQRLAEAVEVFHSQPAGAQAAAAGPAAGGEGPLPLFAGVPPGAAGPAWRWSPVLLLEREDGSPHPGDRKAIYGDYRDNPEH